MRPAMPVAVSPRSPRLCSASVGSSFALAEGLIRFGRAPANTVVLADGRVSGRHARIERTCAGRCYIEDVGSANGTLLNGVLLREPTELRFQQSG
jgi:pSer/pThr/pTyr-binding forkhead associated (FHA) protein